MPSLPPPLSSIPYIPLLYPIPPLIQPLERLQKVVLSRTNLWICREDSNSGLAFGGNKVRKLEYVIHDALSRGADTLVTTGGVQSNHMRQTAAVAAELGLKAVLVPKDMVSPEDATAYNSAGNVQINTLLGAETLAVGTSMEEAMEMVKARGGKPYLIPSGASQHSLGGLGYARWMCEVAEWEKANDEFFDTIMMTAGGCSTLAGAVVGGKLSSAKTDTEDGGSEAKKRRFVGIGIFAQSEEEMKETTLQIVRTTAEKVGLEPEEFGMSDFEIHMQYNAGAYGRLDDTTREAVQLVARTEAVLLDPVYTGKTMAGLLGMLEQGELKEAKNVLFVHTGGQAALAAYPQLR